MDFGTWYRLTAIMSSVLLLGSPVTTASQVNSRQSGPVSPKPPKFRTINWTPWLRL